MSTITRERATLKSFITGFLTDPAHDNYSSRSMTAEVFRIALASLEADAVYFVEIEDGQDINAGRIEGKNRPDLSLLPDGINHLYAAPPAPANAEPVAWLWSHRKHPSEVTLVRPEDDEKAQGAQWSGWSCQALYAELPAPVSVPDDEQCKPHPVMAVKGELGFLDHFDRIISERDEDIDIGQLGSSNYEALMLAALDAFRAAMLQGADGTLTNEGTIPANTPCKEAPEHIWLQTAGVWPENGEFSELTWCSDNQHKDDTLYVRADVVSGNSPVIPDGVCPRCGRKPLKNKTCSVAGCDGKHVARGFCEKHYAIERKKDPSRRESIRAADKRYRARKAAAPQQEVK